MGFSEILGHQRQTETLRLALAKGRLHHAYLFAGPEGVGKRTLALALAKAIHCAERVDDFCGQCANCARIEDGNHPDVRTIEPLAGKKEISIQQIREIEKQLNFRSFSGRKKNSRFGSGNAHESLCTERAVENSGGTPSRFTFSFGSDEHRRPSTHIALALPAPFLWLFAMRAACQLFGIKERFETRRSRFLGRDGHGKSRNRLEDRRRRDARKAASLDRIAIVSQSRRLPRCHSDRGRPC